MPFLPPNQQGQSTEGRVHLKRHAKTEADPYPQLAYIFAQHCVTHCPTHLLTTTVLLPLTLHYYFSLCLTDVSWKYSRLGRVSQKSAVVLTGSACLTTFIIACSIAHHPTHSPRLSNINLVSVPSIHASFGTCSFSAAASNIWNSLPPALRTNVSSMYNLLQGTSTTCGNCRKGGWLNEYCN